LNKAQENFSVKTIQSCRKKSN